MNPRFEDQSQMLWWESQFMEKNQYILMSDIEKYTGGILSLNP